MYKVYCKKGGAVISDFIESFKKIEQAKEYLYKNCALGVEGIEYFIKCDGIQVWNSIDFKNSKCIESIRLM